MRIDIMLRWVDVIWTCCALLTAGATAAALAAPSSDAKCEPDHFANPTAAGDDVVCVQCSWCLLGQTGGARDLSEDAVERLHRKQICGSFADECKQKPASPVTATTEQPSGIVGGVSGTPAAGESPSGSDVTSVRLPEFAQLPVGPPIWAYVVVVVGSLVIIFVIVIALWQWKFCRRSRDVKTVALEGGTVNDEDAPALSYVGSENHSELRRQNSIEMTQRSRQQRITSDQSHRLVEANPEVPDRC